MDDFNEFPRDKEEDVGETLLYSGIAILIFLFLVALVVTPSIQH